MGTVGSEALIDRHKFNVRYAIISLLCVFNLFFCALLDGPDRFLSTFLLALLITLVLFPSKNINLKPIQAWCLGFMIMIAPEGFFNGRFIALLFGVENYNFASLYICFAFSGVCLVASLISLRKYATDRKALVFHQPSRATYITLSVMYLLYLVYLVPLAYTTFTLGRSETLMLETSRSLLESLLAGAGAVAGVTLPAALTYFLMSQHVKKKKNFLYILAILLLGPIVILQFLVGVRSVILATAISVLFVYFTFRPLKIKQIPMLVFLSGVFLVATEIMKGSRLGGGRALGSAQLNLSIENFYEGVVRYMTHMYAYFEPMGFRNGMEHLTLLLFWVPRALWPSKPPQLENWFHRTVEPGIYPSFHSIAATFGATGYADFGFYGGLFFVVLVQGTLLGLIERRTDAHSLVGRGAVSHQVILYGSSLGIIFYSVRQFNSIPIAMVTLLVSYYLINLTMRNRVGKMERDGLVQK